MQKEIPERLKKILSKAPMAWGIVALTDYQTKKKTINELDSEWNNFLNRALTQNHNTMQQKDFIQTFSDLLTPESEWVHASLRKIPPGVVELIEAYQAAAYRLTGPGTKPNRAEALAWVTACALTDGDALEKIAAINEAYLEKQRAELSV